MLLSKVRKDNAFEDGEESGQGSACAGPRVSHTMLSVVDRRLG
jgi:hypothetical protein